MKSNSSGELIPCDGPEGKKAHRIPNHSRPFQSIRSEISQGEVALNTYQNFIYNN